jgi:hypothetical protein
MDEGELSWGTQFRKLGSMELIMIDYTIIYPASSDKPRELINLTFVSKTHGNSEISLLSAHYCPMDTIKMTSTQHRTTCTHTCI